MNIALEAGSVGRDAISLAVARGFYKIVALLAVVFIVRRLGPYDSGVYFFSFAFGRVWGYLVNAGLNHYLIREVAGGKVDPAVLVGDIAGFRIINAVCAMSAAGPAALLLFPRSWQYIVLGTASIVLDEIAYTFSSYFLARRKVVFNIIAGVSSRAVFIALLYLVLISAGGLKEVLLAYFFTSAFFLTASLVLAVRLLGRFKVGFLRYKRLFASGAYFLGIIIILPLAPDMISILLGYLGDIQGTAFFNAAHTICSGALFIPQAATAVLYPVMVGLFNADTPVGLKTYDRYLIVFLLCGCCMSVLLWFFAGPLIAHIFGSHFMASVSALQLLSLSLPFFLANSLNSVCLMSLYKERFLISVLLAGILFNVVLGAALIRLYGLRGAAMTVVVTQALIFAVAVRECRKAQPIKTGICRIP